MQALYHTAFLRDAVFQIPSGTVKAAEVESDSDDEAVGTVGPQRTKKKVKVAAAAAEPAAPVPDSVVVLALQRVFYRLQFSQSSVGTKVAPHAVPSPPLNRFYPPVWQELTRSFGWDAKESFTPHDVRLVRQARDKNEEDRRRECPETALLRKDVGKMLLQWHLRSTSVLKRIEPGAIQRLGAVYEAIYIWRLYMLD